MRIKYIGLLPHPPSILSCRIISAVLFLAAISQGPKSLFSAPVDDTRIMVYATGNLQGKFEPDDMGQGGLAALHTYIERSRRRWNNESNEVILLHTGSFTGADNEKTFSDKIGNTKFNIIDYMKYDALLFPDKEKSPALKNEISSVCPENTVLKNKKIDFYIKHIAKKNTGIDILCITKEPEKNDITETLKNQKKTGLFFILSNLNGRNIFPDTSLKEDLPEDSIEQRTFIFQSNDGSNYFRRSETGSFICNTTGYAVCELEIILRSGQIISVQQKFLTVNDRNLPQPNYEADKTIAEFLSR